MADQSSHNVVNQVVSTSEQSPVDAHANQPSTSSAIPGTQTTTLEHDAPVTSHDHSSSVTGSGESTNILEINESSTAPDSTETVPTRQDLQSQLPAEEQMSNENLHGLLNGSQEGAGSADEAANVDNVGSDTDTSRADSTELSKDASAQARLNALKKPISFKPVSITRKFLAKTVTTTPNSVAGTGEKAPATGILQSIAKPRLVAKSGSGLRDLPRTRSSDATGTPDGRTVWNKNQPIPAPPPKQFTDEELKLKYGIHLATRLDDNEPSGKSKWADIDDDEDDWAPETVEWMDGTKSSVNTIEPQPVLPEPVKLLEKEQQEQAPPVKPVMTALKRTILTAPTKTILKPGAAALQAKQNGSSGKNVTDKPTLVAKSPAPTPVKSPWAPLPPVDKVSPVVIEPPVQQPQNPAMFGHRDPHGFEAFSQPSPAREIAADTFDRSWMEHERGSRELFNSQSGKYEPAPNHRRNSRQQDGSRQPALLHRPSQQNAMSPAEPSAAFQTRSSSQMDGTPWSRRRGSSVSGSSIPRDRRISMTKSGDSAPFQNDSSAVAVAEDDEAPAATSDQRRLAPPVEDTPRLTVEEEREKQKKLMQTRRETALANKRERQEIEAREEAERKERLRKKLEELSMPSVEQKETPEASVAAAHGVESPQTSVQAQAQGPPKDPQDTVPAENTAAAQSAALSAAEAPNLESQISSTKQASPRKERTTEAGLPSFSQKQTSLPRAPNKFESPQLPGLRQQSPNMPTRTPYQQQQPTVRGVSGSAISSPGEKAQPVRLPGLANSDTFSPWGSSNITTHTAPGSSVWGPPSSNRNIGNGHIGNGTFDNSFARLSPNQPQQQNQPAAFSNPVPFGRQLGHRNPPQGFGQSPPLSGTKEPQYTPISQLDPRVTDPASAPQTNGISPLPEFNRSAYQPGPIAPPHKSAASRNQQLPPRDTSAWTKFAAQTQVKDETQIPAIIEHRQDQPQQRWTETFKQTGVGNNWLGGPRKLVGTETIVHGDQPVGSTPFMGSPLPPVSQTSSAHHMISPQPSRMEQARDLQPESTVKLPTGPSSFNKTPNRPAGVPNSIVRLPPHPSVAAMAASHQSRFFPAALYGDSPPPEEAGHPVSVDDIGRPLVKLPTPKPKVRLPVTATPHGHESPVTMPRQPSHRMGAQPLVQSSDWQARFNGLFGRVQITANSPPSPPGTPPKSDPILAVATSSRAGMDFAFAQTTTTVSLPPRPAPRPIAPTHLIVVSKSAVDAIFDGELSFGSTPRVFLPRGVQYPELSSDSPDSASGRPNSKFARPVLSQSKDGMPAYLHTSYLPNTIVIHLPYASGSGKEVPFTHKHEERVSMKARKTSQKLSNRTNKPKKHAGNQDSGSGSPQTASSPASKTGSRTTSFQKSHAPSSGEASTKLNPIVNGQPVGGGEQSPRNNKWPRAPQGRNHYRKAQV